MRLICFRHSNIRLEGDDGYRWFAEEPERTRASLGPTPIADMIALGVIKLQVDPGLVTVTCAGICVSPKKLSAMIALACRISHGGDTGPYR